MAAFLLCSFLVGTAQGRLSRVGEGRSVIRRWTLAFGMLALSAAMLSVTIANPAFWPVGWLALWPIFYLLDQGPSTRVRLVLGLLWLFLISQLGFPYAVATAYHHLQGSNPLGAWLMGTTLGIVTSLRYAVFMLLAGQRPGRIFYWASLWCACELLIWQMMPVYGGVHVLGDVALVQWAEMLGAPGLSWLWFVLSLALFDAVRGRPKAVVSVTVFLLAHGVGFALLHYWQQRVERAPRHLVAVIQANQPPNLQPVEQVGLEARRRMLQLTELFLASLTELPEVVVWPEASMPLISYQSLGGLRLERGCQLIFIDHEAGTQAGYVVARLLDGQGRSLASYRKRKLIMMGEWTPWDRAHSLQVGDSDQLLPTALGPALPLVCFEGLWPSFVAAFHCHTGATASWLVHLGSESSFGSELACRQSLHLATLRTVELRRPMVRADNSGISGWIDATGHLHDATAAFTSHALLLEVAIDRNPGCTLYTRWGDAPLWLLIAAGLWLGLRPKRANSPL